VPISVPLQQVVHNSDRFEMPSNPEAQGRSGGMPDRGRPAQDVL
jgi:hypothetical protein